MDGYYITALVLGFFIIIDCALLFVFGSRTKTLICKAVFDTISFVQLLFIYLYSGESVVFVAMAGNAIGLTRDIIFLLQAKYKWANSIIFLIIFEAAFIASGIIAWRGPICILFVVASVLSTLGLYTKDDMRRTIISLIAMAMQAIYYGILVPSSDLLTTMNLIGHCIICISCILGIINIIYRNKKAKTEAEKL